MKNYDLSKYMIKSGEVLIFPLTQEEISILKSGMEEFSNYIRLPYITGVHSIKTLEKLEKAVDMENDYWFMNSLWMVVHTKSKEIYGTVRYEKEGEFNKIIKNITVLMDAQETYEEAINLFAKFLSVNNYNNILVEQDEEVI